MKAYVEAIASVLPDMVVQNQINSRLTKKTGIEERHIAGTAECASDFAVRAAEKLFLKCGKREKIDYVLFCTQSPDFILPTTACLLQDRLNLRRDCGALDYNLGCSGYVYGLSLAKGLIESGQAENVLLLTAETYSKYIRQGDSSVEPLFGDGGTATIITGRQTEREGLYGFSLGTDGRGAEDLMIERGGARFPYRIEEAKPLDKTFFLEMDGAKISAFALTVVPELLDAILQKVNLKREEIDYFVFHQANRFMLDFLRLKCGLQGYPYWNQVRNCGNTVSNSIPLALCEMLQENPKMKREKILLAGFGVGLSWGGCVADLSLVRG